MNLEELEKAWREQGGDLVSTTEPGVLAQKISTRYQAFRREWFWSYFTEIAVGVPVIAVLEFYATLKFLGQRIWAWHISAASILFVVLFLLIDHIRQRDRGPILNMPVTEAIEHSLKKVDHIIWLLRNIFWWYLLPPGLAVAAPTIQFAWVIAQNGAVAFAVSFLATILSFMAVVFYGVYRWNRRVIRKKLRPQRDELAAILHRLKSAGPHEEGETTNEKDSGRRGWGPVVILTLLLCGSAAASFYLAFHIDLPDASEDSCPVAGDEAITALLKPIRQQHNVPAMAAAIVTSHGVERVGVVGVRKRGTEIPAMVDDKWHLGSDTKAMTASLVARLVEQGRLKWDTTVAEVFPAMAAEFHPDMKGVTILQLLSHRAGLPENLDLREFGGDDAPKERLRAVREELARPPACPPGSETRYSNLGYVIVGAIIERITGKSWEQAIRDEIFEPLGMRSVGFGGTGTPGQIDQPWGHSANGKPVGGNGPKMDNPPVMGPVGRVHCTMQDWAKFIVNQLRGDRGEPALLKSATYKTLHTPPFGGDYALGWIVTEREWGGGMVLTHCGSNTMNFANIWIAPQRDFAILVCVNQGGDVAFKASDEAVGALTELLGKRLQIVPVENAGSSQ